jgi:hypothetical protein
VGPQGQQGWASESAGNPPAGPGQAAAAAVRASVPSPNSAIALMFQPANMVVSILESAIKAQQRAWAAVSGAGRRDGDSSRN